MSILVTDSGIGGFGILKRLVTRMPECDYVYYADNANLPYGEKSEVELRAIAVNNFTRLSSRFDIECAVIACNTLTAAAVEVLRDSFSFPIIGTEPALLPAARCFKSGNIYLFSTSYTASSKRLSGRFADLKDRVRLIALPRLAEMTEECVCREEIGTYIRGIAPIEEEGAFPIVLGCTHYALAEDVIRELYPKAVLFGGEEGTAENAIRTVRSLPYREYTRLRLLDNKSESFGREELFCVDIPRKGDILFIETADNHKKSKKMSELFVQYYCKDCFFTV